MSNGSLFVWSRRAFTPVNPFPLNHTWVTTYQNPGPPNGFVRPFQTLPFPEEDHYWFCWGLLHSGGDKHQNPKPYVAWKEPANADRQLASCICQSNVESNPASPAWPRAGIEGKYGHNAVCHQVANRILWSAGLQEDGTAYTVEGVHGWRLSWDFFGVYGYRDDSSNWEQVLDGCSGLGPFGRAVIARMNERRPRLRNPGVLDKIRGILNDILGDKGMRDALHDFGRCDAREHANSVNELARIYLAESFKSVGSEGFHEYFEFAFEENVTPIVVDPDVAVAYEKLEKLEKLKAREAEPEGGLSASASY